MTAPILKQIENISIYGFSTRTQNQDEFNNKTAKIPAIWQEFHASPIADQTEVYGVYSDYLNGAEGLYTVTAGVPNAPHILNLKKVTIQAGNYLVFEEEGAMPDSVIKTWQRIWAYFLNQSTYKRNFISDFECYSAKDKVAIYIGVFN